MHCSETCINVSYNLHRFLDFASTRISPKTCPAVSWDQALLLSPWVNRFQALKANRRLPFRAVLLYLNYLCLRIECVIMIVASLACAFTWLLWHQRGLWTQHQDLRDHIPFIPCILVGTTQECEEIEKKSTYTVKKRCRWLRIGGGLLLSPAIRKLSIEIIKVSHSFIWPLRARMLSKCKSREYTKEVIIF